jgi:hypothetical protein
VESDKLPLHLVEAALAVSNAKLRDREGIGTEAPQVFVEIARPPATARIADVLKPPLLQRAGSLAYVETAVDGALNEVNDQAATSIFTVR